MSENQDPAACEVLWRHITSACSTPECVAHSAVRECESGCCSGYRLEISTWTFKQDDYTLCAVQRTADHLSPLADTRTIIRQLVVQRGTTCVFMATKKHGGMANSFDVDEYLLESRELPSEPWCIAEGVVPPEIVKAAA